MDQAKTSIPLSKAAADTKPGQAKVITLTQEQISLPGAGLIESEVYKLEVDGAKQSIQVFMWLNMHTELLSLFHLK